MSQKARQSSQSHNIMRYMNLPNAITTGNAVSGFLSIIYAIRHEHAAACIFMLLAVALDFLDGRTARWLRQTSDFGKELDSLADMISFGLAPAVFGYSLGLDRPWEVAALAFFVACGALRLARFSVMDIKGFIGVPITTNGYIFPILYIIIHPFGWWAALLYAAMGVLMISSLRIPKV